MPKRALSTNWGVDRWTRRSTSRPTAATTLTIKASLSSWVVRKKIVNSSVGIAVSSMPRLPPRAVAICWRTTRSTVSTEAGVDSVNVTA